MDIWQRLIPGKKCFILIICSVTMIIYQGRSESNGDSTNTGAGDKKKIIPKLVCNNSWCSSEFIQNLSKFKFSTIGLLAAGYDGYDTLESKVALTFFVQKKEDIGTYILEAKALVQTKDNRSLSGKTRFNAFGVISEDDYPVLPEPEGDGYKPFCTPLLPLPGINICLNLYIFKCNTVLEGCACFRVEFIVYQKVIRKFQYDCINFSRNNITLSPPVDGGGSISVPEKKKWFQKKT